MITRRLKLSKLRFRVTIEKCAGRERKIFKSIFLIYRLNVNRHVMKCAD